MPSHPLYTFVLNSLDSNFHANILPINRFPSSLVEKGVLFGQNISATISASGEERSLILFQKLEKRYYVNVEGFKKVQG